jgi:hypothetical protein
LQVPAPRMPTVQRIPPMRPLQQMVFLGAAQLGLEGGFPVRASMSEGAARAMAARARIAKDFMMMVWGWGLFELEKLKCKDCLKLWGLGKPCWFGTVC